MDEEELKAAIIHAGDDEHGIAARRELCQALASTFRKTGKVLWLGGYFIGPDRVDGTSPFKFGSDATVALGTIVQIAGELSSGVISLLDQCNRYSAAALLRQLVEVEYLTWAFAEDQEDAMNWLRSSKEERITFWLPGRVRERAGGRFRKIDYALHCERGGHPSPESNRLLPAHNNDPDFLTWHDLAFHGQSAWDYILVAADRFQYGDEIRALPEVQWLSTAREDRQRSDPLVPLLADARTLLDADTSLSRTR